MVLQPDGCHADRLQLSARLAEVDGWTVRGTSSINWCILPYEELLRQGIPDSRLGKRLLKQKSAISVPATSRLRAFRYNRCGTSRLLTGTNFSLNCR